MNSKTVLTLLITMYEYVLEDPVLPSPTLSEGSRRPLQFKEESNPKLGIHVISFNKKIFNMPTLEKVRIQV
jgi:hypothetical protein